MTAIHDKTAADWLRRLKWALSAMPPSDRDDILAETAGHIDEAMAEGRAPADVLAAFGPPDAYARRFLDEMELTVALGSQRSGDLFGAITRRVHRSLIAAVAGVVTLVLATAVLFAVTLAIMEIQDPVHTGLWLGPRVQFIGQIDDIGSARDLLGPWLLPACAAVVGLAVVTGRLVLLAAVRRLVRRG